jgi:hypothetical protein
MKKEIKLGMYGEMPIVKIGEMEVNLHHRTVKKGSGFK